MTCDKGVKKEDCDVLLKKYNAMKEMYNDPDLMEMLQRDAYNELHREMEEAGMNVKGTTKKVRKYYPNNYLLISKTF